MSEHVDVSKTQLYLLNYCVNQMITFISLYKILEKKVLVKSEIINVENN